MKRILTGRYNYITWRITIEISLSGRSQLSFIKGEYPKPVNHMMAARWQKCNDIVMLWLISSVSERIGEQVMRSKDVISAWNSLMIQYGGTNLVRKSVLMTQISGCTQGDSDAATYFDRLSNFWQELDAVKKVKSCISIGMCACCT